MARYTLPLILLFIGGICVALSAPIREQHALISSVLFYLGYALDALAIILAIKIAISNRK